MSKEHLSRIVGADRRCYRSFASIGRRGLQGIGERFLAAPPRSRECQKDEA
jgi:hypothetical protein